MAASPTPPDDLAAAHEMIARLNAVLAQKDEAIARQERIIAQSEEAISRQEQIIAKTQEAIAQRDIEMARLMTILRKLQRRQFGQKSEKLDPDQMALGLEDIESAIGDAEAHQEAQDATLKASRGTNRGVKRGKLPAHLPRIEHIVDIADKSCPCCAKPLHMIGEDVSERLDVVPSQYRVLVTRRPKYACRACTDGVVQAPAPPRLVEGGLPTEALIAHLLVGKYADHLPLYRQHQILLRAGIDIDRPCLADWVGRAIFALRPVAARMLEQMKRSGKLFCDETTAPVLDPGKGKVKKGYLWAIARDDRPWNGPEPPGVVYVYAPSRGGQNAMRALEGFKGVLQVDGYGGYNALADAKRRDDPLQLAFCWAHWRREFFELAKGGHAPIADEALKRIAALYEIEARIRGQSEEARRAARQSETAPLVDDLFTWLQARLERIMQGGDLAGVIRYGLKRREGLTRFLEDGRIEIDNNTVERGMRGIALNRKNALFAGSDEGGAAWGVIASLIETCKLNGVEPNAYLTKTLTRIVNGWPANRLDELLPWAHVA